jgi:hypothetical protein
MTRKDYEAIAKAINDCTNADGKNCGTIHLIKLLSDVFKSDNEGFDRNTFYFRSRYDHMIRLMEEACYSNGNIYKYTRF